MNIIEPTLKAESVEGLEDDEFLGAFARLGAFVVRQASFKVAELGFTFIGSNYAPTTFAELVTAFKHSVETGDALPVSSENMASIIFTSPSVNLAMRFWHDVSHFQFGLTFNLIDELELAHVAHLDPLIAAGYGTDSLEYQLLHADLAGQVYLLAVTGDFPTDQRTFVKRCLRLEFDRAIVMTGRELRERTS